MMRRNRTSRRVQTLSPDSIRSDDIASTDIAWSREESRESDIGCGAGRPLRRGIWGKLFGIAVFEGLELRFRSSHDIAATSDANFGIQELYNLLILVRP